MTRDNRGMTCIVATFFVSSGAWLAYVAHARWVNAHIYPVAVGYALLIIGILYFGTKWIGKS